MILRSPGLGHFHPAILRLPVLDRCFGNPYLRAKSAVFAPASASFSTPMICSSVNLVLFISSVLLSGPDSNQTWMKIRGSRHVLKNIDELFQHDDMLAAPDWGIDITSDFNSGVDRKSVV